MKGINSLIFSIFCILVFASSALSLPPAQIGDSFLVVDTSTKLSSAEQVFYFGADGTCKLLSSSVTSTGAPTYAASQAGTYSYVPSAGDPTVATLTINLSGSSVNGPATLTFTGDTHGDVGATFGLGTFSLYLATPNTFLTNVSNRSLLGATDSAISGFVIQGTESRFVMVRGIGPGLAQFAVSPVSANPQLSLFVGPNLAASGQIWNAVTGYDSQAMSWMFEIAGAFSLQTGSNDEVYFAVLAPGAYTAVVSDPTIGTTRGNLLTEVYILPYSE
jgi:hypothetical protein